MMELMQLKFNLNAEQLNDLYCKQLMSSCQIAEIIGVHSTTILNRLKSYGITRRSPNDRQSLAVKSGRRKPQFKLKLSRDELFDLYWKQNKTAKEIGKLCNVSENPVFRRMKRLDIPMRTAIEAKRLGRELGKYHNARGELACNWKGGRIICDGGYVRVKIQPDNLYHIMTDQHNYVLEHRYIMAQMLGRPLEKWEQPHHRDGNKSNNTPSNLELRIGNHGKGASLKSYEDELLKRLAELYEENESLKKSMQPDQTAGNIIGEIVANGKEIQSLGLERH